MTLEEPEPNHISDHILDWLEDSASFLPSFLDDPYNASDINSYQWWNQTEEICQDPINTNTSLSSSTNTTLNADSISLIGASDPTTSSHQQPSNLSRKREATDDPVPETSQNHHHQRKKQNHRISNEDQDGEQAAVEVVAGKRSNGNKKSNSKSTGNNGNNGNNREGRWAEHLLNPCAAAITIGNLSRVQHLLYVLHELASSTGDANHRLAFYGLRALTHYLSPSTSSASIGPISFASTEPKFFQRTLLKFYEVSPWFAFPNNIANSSILQILAQELDHKRNLHILDIGVSHGVQWPTLLEALTRRPGGPPPLRITVITATVEMIKTLRPHFQLHHLNHNPPDERTEFLRILKGLEPKGVIISENNTDCSCNSCGDFATGFSRRVDYLWKFLDSTSSAFKGRESEERRVMEGEAAKALTNRGEMNEGKEKWCERMRGVGFVGEVFGEDTIDGGRALLRKYDSNWEMRTEEKDGCIGLWWKGLPVSFCSLWKLDLKGNES
ncbi:hypothetical protein GH714_018620 [Hevea brasiliensis]|uniref:Uncharacterized protein n=1 Tax=Hevea brasiliensis TaxID=3981 RepID=A0A6A6LHM6_HEVBR|nr:hypothetical protein GH714_018620 [Hevea brasiliensis]